MSSYSGVEKSQMRQATSPSRRLTHIFDLSSEEARSTKHFVEKGVADRNTNFTIAEHNRSAVPGIYSKFKSLNLAKPNIFTGKLQDCPLTGPYELVNLDTCSTPSEPIFNWISRLSILQGGELNLWVTAFRNSGLWRQTLIDAFVYNKDGIIVLNELQDTGLFESEIKIEQKCVAGALAASLSFYDFDITFPSVLNRPPGQYCDNRNTMYVYRLTNMKLRKKPVRPSLVQILATTRPTKYFPASSYSVSSKSTAAEMASQLIITAVKTGKKGEATRLINKRLSDADYLHKSRKMVKAGFKAQVTKMEPDKIWVKRVHQYIDSI